MRQQGSDSDQLFFRELIKNISEGKVTQSNWKTLMERQLSLQSEEIKNQFHGATYLYPLKEDVKNRNLNHLRRLNKPVCLIRAEDNFPSDPNKYEDCENLEKELKISVGSKVMLRHNLDVNKGLVNGSIGYVTDIIFKYGESPPEKQPKIILVHFPNSKCQEPVPITPIKKSWTSGSRTFTRKQFPLILAYSLTLHKSQGLTLDKVILNIGSNEKWLGSTYVAISRVRRLSELCFETSYDYSRFERIGNSQNFRLLTEDLQRLKELGENNL